MTDVTATDVPVTTTEPGVEPVDPSPPTLTRTLAAVGRVVAPTALLTAVLYYFGWARTEAAADRAGTDQSLFGYSTSDYVLRSVGPLYRPIGIALAITAVLIIAAGAARELLSVRIDRGDLSQHRVGTFVVVLVGLAIVAIAFGALGLDDVRTQEPAHLSAALILCGALLLWGALALAELGTGDISSAVRRQRPLILGVVLAMFLVSIFAIVLRLAFDDGVGSINAFIDDLAQQPEVVVTSSRPLDIDLPGVQPEVVQASADQGTTTRFRYRGLRFLLEANGRVFLVTEGFGKTDGTSAIAVIPDSADLRLDFVGDGR